MTLVLASGSETRAKMLRDAGIEIEVVPSTVDEDAIKRERDPRDNAWDLAAILAEAKAQEVSARMPSRLVLGSDQVLVFKGATFDKANNRDEAAALLRFMRGERHALLSGAALVRDGHVVWQTVGHATMAVLDFSDAFLEEYLDAVGDAAFWSVGGYQIEGRGSQLFESISGDYFSILGLPLIRVLRALRDEGVIQT